ncbi:glycosyl transferase family 1 [Oceaniferula spumae]|uniref:Glycosyl transferase family 1 n=1 Tax=Oceaniferula spumae TaxID=2979115 RepID=A0AAT9FHC3_9BACT
MRILQIITRMDSIGGAQRHVIELCQAARAEGHEVHLAFGGGCALSDDEVKGVELHCIESLLREISPVKDFRATRELYHLITTINPDLVATHSTKAGVLGRLAAARAKVCNVHTVHGWSVNFSGNPLKRFVYKQIESRVHRLADGIICVCEYDHGHAKKLGFDTNKLTVIYNGRPDTNVTETGYEPPTDHVRIVSIGRMAWPKQPEQLLRYLAKDTTTQLDLLGDGPREEEVKNLAKELGVDDRVVFHGHVDRIYPLLAQAHIFALVSDWEGFPMSTLEAMAAGLPTVVSAVGGAPEAISEGVTGFTIPRGDEDTLHRRLEELVNDEAQRQRLGRAARDKYLQQFRLETMVEKTLEFYLKCRQRKA